ncbi:unnamed protein product, partial [Polarella glacialis]
AWQLHVEFGSTQGLGNLQPMNLESFSHQEDIITKMQPGGRRYGDLCPMISIPSSLSTCSTDDCSSPSRLYDLPWTCSSTDVQAKPVRVPGPWLLAGASCVAKQTKYGQCEDAYFVQERSLGVADGVGSMARFSRDGVDCAAFAAELMSLAAEALKPEGAVGEGPPEQRT